MKIVSIIDRHQKDVLKHNFNNENKFSVSIIVKKILRHCDLWTDSSPPITKQSLAEAEQEFVEEVTIDPDFFDMIA